MNDLLIQAYINKLTIDDIKQFARKEGIPINDNESTIIYTYLKDYWRTILYGNPKCLLQELKAKLGTESYLKIEQLYIKLKSRIN